MESRVEKSVNPEMVIVARESRGMSQTDLAEAIDISQGKVSKYENGLLEVSDHDLERIGRATGYTDDFFRQTSTVYGLGSSAIFNRKHKTIPISIQRRFQAQVNIQRMQIERLLRGAEIESDYAFEPIDIQKYDGDAATIARIIRAAWRMPIGPVQSVTAAIESAGGVVLLCDFGPAGIDAAHLWLSGLPPLFFMNSQVPGERHRFNLAHEIGHAIMHRYPVGDIEAEANAFAREFLMPANEIGNQLVGLTVEKAIRLKPIWKVSAQAIIYQAKCLGKITERQSRSMFTRLSAAGFRKNEPLPLPMEEPVLASQLVELHRKAFGYSDVDLLRLLFQREPDPSLFRLLENKPSARLQMSDEPLRIAR
jgi:Zn-dependent peptidase ImmA (M78 family)/DNA-binding XRE family transcriptional regulator